MGCQNPAALMTGWSAGFALPPLKRGCRARTACIPVRTTSSQGHGALRGEQSCGGVVRAPGGIYCCVQQTPPFCLLCLGEDVLPEMFHVQFLPWPLPSASKWGKKYFQGAFGTFRLCKEELGRTGSESVFYLCALGTWGRRLEQGEGKCSEIDE